MSEFLPSLGYQVGIGAVGGFIVGYALKKISKLVAVIVGLFLIALIYLATQGLISIDTEALWVSITNALGLASSAFSWLASVLAILPIAGSLGLGLLLGFKLG